jgi:hypothetical protein
MDEILSPNLTMVLTQGEIFFVYCWDLVFGHLSWVVGRWLYDFLPSSPNR